MSKNIIISIIIIILIYEIYNLCGPFNKTSYINYKGVRFGTTSTLDPEEKLDRLKEIKLRLDKIVEHCVSTKFPDRSKSFRLQQRWKNVSVNETSFNEKTVAYMIDKGTSLNICVTDKKTQQLSDMNTTMFVAIHELAHVMSNSWGHGDEFWSNFEELLQAAINIKVYTYVDYSKKNKMFCGTNIYSEPCSNSTCV